MGIVSKEINVPVVNELRKRINEDIQLLKVIFIKNFSDKGTQFPINICSFSMRTIAGYT